MNDGLGGSLFTVVDAAAIQNRPYLNKHTVLGLTHVGEFYSFMIRAYNEIDFVTSGAERMLLASVPDKPSSKPV